MKKGIRGSRKLKSRIAVLLFLLMCGRPSKALGALRAGIQILIRSWMPFAIASRHAHPVDFCEPCLRIVCVADLGGPCRLAPSGARRSRPARGKGRHLAAPSPRRLFLEDA